MHSHTLTLVLPSPLLAFYFSLSNLKLLLVFSIFYVLTSAFFRVGKQTDIAPNLFVAAPVALDSVPGKEDGHLSVIVIL